MGKALEEQERVICIDSKHRVNWPGYYLTDDPRACFIEDKTIYRHTEPPPSSFWREATEYLHEQGGGVVYIDEMPVLTGPGRIPAGLADGFRMGAEIGVGYWWAAQEATGVHNTVIRQSEIILLFLNQGASDRDKLIKTCGDIGEVTSSLEPRQFVVFENFGQAYDPDNIPVFQVTA